MSFFLIRSLYRLIQCLAFPFIVLYLGWRGLRNKRYLQGIQQRLGRLPRSYRQTAPGAVWLHAVSVGEIISSTRLIADLRTRFPKVFVSTSTLAGRELAQERLKGVADGVFYAPIDYCFAVRRVLRTIRPSLVIVLETEIWPNLWHETRRTGAALLVANARISDRAFPRYRALAWFFRAVLADPQAILAQTEVSRQRYLELGAPPDRVTVAGNLKYDFDPSGKPPPDAVLQLLAAVQAAPIWIAASTMPPLVAGDIDEDDAVLDAFQKLAPSHPRLLLILVPRRPERFDEAARKLDARGIQYVRRTRLDKEAELPLPGVLLLDTIGELASLFPIADVVFMGGTLAQRGGHNILEPAFAARPIVIGPHMENFPEIAAEFRRQNAVVQIDGPTALADAVDKLLRDGNLRKQLGDRAQALSGAQRGATANVLRVAEMLNDNAIPRRIPPAPLRPLFWLATRLWNAGSSWKRRSTEPRRLNTPVISIGGISMGGAAKTPLTVLLARTLEAEGRRVAVLTRGYHRQSPQPCTILERGHPAPIYLTGDEAQILLRSGASVVGIGADRYAVGKIIEEQYKPDVFLLDDGFQHWGLHRDLDIVAIDAIDPFPLGRMREAPAALARAGVIVITRAEAVRPYAGLLKAIGSSARIMNARVVPGKWRDLATGAEVTPQIGKAGAFCGLGNPASFWRTISYLRPQFEASFPDHHRYATAEIEALARRGIEALLTTEKDVLNLPDGVATGVPIYWLPIELEVDGLTELLTSMVFRK